MIEIKEVTGGEKEYICMKILSALPNWFGIESSIVEYTNEVKNHSFFVAYKKTLLLVL